MSEGTPIRTDEFHVAPQEPLEQPIQPSTGIDILIARGLPVLPEDFAVPLDPRGKTSWQKLSENPELLKSYIENEVAELVAEGIPITFDALISAGKAPINYAIGHLYKGGYKPLRELLGDAQISDRKPSRFWQDPKNIEYEAARIVKLGIGLTNNQLKRAGRSDFVSTIYKYPGGFNALRTKIGVANPNRKPMGFWTDEGNIEALLRGHIELHGHFPTSGELKKFPSLSIAVSKRGFPYWREKVGHESSQKPSGYWNEDVIEIEARKAMQSGIKLTNKDLCDNGLSDLAGAISRRYRGRYTSLKKVLGLDTKKEKGYWDDIQNIEKEAQIAMNNGVSLTSMGLRKAGYQSLAVFVSRNYPGGYDGLREKLGLAEPQISPDRADEMMRGLEVSQ